MEEEYNEEDEIQMYIKCIEKFYEISKHGIKNFENENVINFFNKIPFIKLKIDIPFKKFHRLTINKRVLQGANKRIHEIDLLKYPPKNYVKNLGRCNFENQSIMYVSTTPFNLPFETNAELGDLVTETTWQLKNKFSLSVVPIFKNNSEIDTTFDISSRLEKDISHLSKSFQKFMNYSMQFLADEFSKKVKQNDYVEYLFTANASNNFLFQNNLQGFQGILYPSVPTQGTTWNLAILPDVFDANYELVEVNEGIIVTTPHNSPGGYFEHSTAFTKSIDYEKGKVIWESKDSVDEHLKQIIEKYNVDLT
jgi:hypothetical protein